MYQPLYSINPYTVSYPSKSSSPFAREGLVHPESHHKPRCKSKGRDDVDGRRLTAAFSSAVAEHLGEYPLEV